MKKILLFAISIVVFFSCEQKDIMVFSDINRIYFEKFFINELAPGRAEADSTVNSFFFYPESQTSIDVIFNVLLSGLKLEKDQEFQLKVVEEYTTAKPEDYTIAPSYTFSKDALDPINKVFSQPIKVQFHKTQNLIAAGEKGVRLVVELVPNDFFGIGQTERSRAVLIGTVNPAQPEWWTYEVSQVLGEYSAKKFQLFIKIVDPDAEVNKDFIKDSPDKFLEKAYVLKKYLIEKGPFLDENGNEVKLAI